MVSSRVKPVKLSTSATLPLTQPQSKRSLPEYSGAHSAVPPAEPGDTLVTLGRLAEIAHFENSRWMTSLGPSVVIGSPGPPSTVT